MEWGGLVSIMVSVFVSNLKLHTYTKYCEIIQVLTVLTLRRYQCIYLYRNTTYTRDRKTGAKWIGFQVFGAKQLRCWGETSTVERCIQPALFYPQNS